jgi:hypothetical protein
MSARSLTSSLGRTALDPVSLIDFTRIFAADVAAGQYPFVEYDEHERWHQRIYRDQRVDVWLISWMPTQGTALHDHGGSSGAFTVVSGRLTESVLTGRSSVPGHRSLLEVEREFGESVGFASNYIHDVRNASSEPAVSVHAYSAPLTSMTYYELESGDLRTIATVATEDPEHELTADDLRAAS